MSFNKSDKVSYRELSPELTEQIDYLGNRKTSKDYTVSGDTIGAWGPGVVIPAGTLVSDVIEGILDSDFEFIYKPPKLSFDNLDKYYEVGQTIQSLEVTPTWVQNDAGQITSYDLYRQRSGNSETSVVESLNIQPYYEPADWLSDPVTEIPNDGKIVTFRAVVKYNAGPKKTNPETGELYEGNIIAGKIEKIININGYRKIFYGSDNTTQSCNDSDKVRSLPNFSTNMVKEGQEFNINCPAGTRRVVFAIPKYINGEKYNISVLSDRTNYIIYKSSDPGDNPVFKKEDIEVCGCNNLYPTAYNVYTYIPPVGFPESDIYTITIYK